MLHREGEEVLLLRQQGHQVLAVVWVGREVEHLQVEVAEVGQELLTELMRRVPLAVLAELVALLKLGLMVLIHLTRVREGPLRGHQVMVSMQLLHMWEPMVQEVLRVVLMAIQGLTEVGQTREEGEVAAVQEDNLVLVGVLVFLARVLEVVVAQVNSSLPTVRLLQPLSEYQGSLFISALLLKV
jgi:hypothetical protein